MLGNVDLVDTTVDHLLGMLLGLNFTLFLIVWLYVFLSWFMMAQRAEKDLWRRIQQLYIRGRILVGHGKEWHTVIEDSMDWSRDHDTNRITAGVQWQIPWDLNHTPNLKMLTL